MVPSSAYSAFTISASQFVALLWRPVDVIFMWGLPRGEGGRVREERSFRLQIVLRAAFYDLLVTASSY